MNKRGLSDPLSLSFSLSPSLSLFLTSEVSNYENLILTCYEYRSAVISEPQKLNEWKSESVRREGVNLSLSVSLPFELCFSLKISPSQSER